MRFLRIMVSSWLFLLLVFFLIGVESSNDWESDPSSPISAGTLGKITLVPICIVLGLLLFKVAGPLFGGTRFAARSEQYQQKAQTKIVDNRYRMGNSLPLAYGLAFIGLIQILIGISNADGKKVLTGIAIGAAGLYVRGRLQSEQAAAKALGARTLGDDVSQGVADGINLVGQVVVGTAEFAVSAAIKGGKLLGAKIQKALEAQTNNAQSAHMAKELTSGVENMNSEFDTSEWLAKFISLIKANYQTQLGILRSPTTQQAFGSAPSPVSSGRQLLLDAFRAQPSGKSRTLTLLNEAIALLDKGCVSPDPNEWFIDGPEIGRGHACMWGGIAKTLAHQQAGAAFSPDFTKSDGWFGTAVLIFLETGEYKMAGRALQEWAESNRLINNVEEANTLNIAAVMIFSSMNELGRAETAGSRIDQVAPCSVDSSFFLGRPPTQSETSILTTVLGGRNTEQFYKALG